MSKDDKVVKTEDKEVKPKPKRKKPEVAKEGTTVLTRADSEMLDEKKKERKKSEVWGEDRVFKPFED